MFNIISSDRTHKKPKSLPWVDKYRPKRLNDVVHQVEVIELLKRSIETKTLPHLLLYGPPGTGKTSTILACCYEMFGPDNLRNRVLELNASEDRGINVVRTKIMKFAQTALSNDDERFPSPAFKIIILDEADAMTIEAQSALRKIIEEHTDNTRFCFICNYINQIIEPIVSRCMKFRFKPIGDGLMVKKLKTICKNEDFNIDKKLLVKINKICHGDARKSIMMLQNLKYIYDHNNKVLTKKHIYDLSGYVSKKYIGNVLDICLDDATTVADLIGLANHTKNNAYPIINVLQSLSHCVINMNSIKDFHKHKISLFLSLVERRLNDGSDEYIQMLDVFSYINGLVVHGINPVIDGYV